MDVDVVGDGDGITVNDDDSTVYAVDNSHRCADDVTVDIVVLNTAIVSHSASCGGDSTTTRLVTAAGVVVAIVRRHSSVWLE